MRGIPTGSALVLALFLAASAGASGPNAPAEAPTVPATLALVGGWIIDGYEGRPIEDGVVLISGNRITAVGTRSQVAVPAGVATIDTRGMSVLPGMADMH